MGADDDERKPLLEDAGPLSTFELTLLVMTSALVVVTAYMQGPALPLIASDMGVSLSMAVASLYANWAMVSVATPILGAIADARGQKRVLLESLAVVLIGSGLCATAPNIWFLIGGRCFQGIGEGGSMSVAVAILRNAYDDDSSRNEAFAFMYQVYPVVTCLAPSLGGTLAYALGWRSIFVVSFALCALNIVAVVFYLPKTRDGNSELSVADSLADLKTRLSTCLRQPTVAPYTLFLVILRTGVLGTVISLYPYVLPTLGLTTLETGLCIGTIGVATAFGATLNTYLAALRNTPTTIVHIGLSLLVVSVGALAAAVATDRPRALERAWLAAIAVAGCLECFTCTVVPAASSILMGLIDPSFAGAMSGLLYGSMFACYAATAVVSSLALASYPPSAGLAYVIFIGWIALAAACYLPFALGCVPMPQDRLSATSVAPSR